MSAFDLRLLVATKNIEPVPRLKCLAMLDQETGVDECIAVPIIRTEKMIIVLSRSNIIL